MHFGCQGLSSGDELERSGGEKGKSVGGERTGDFPDRQTSDLQCAAILKLLTSLKESPIHQHLDGLEQCVSVYLRHCSYVNSASSENQLSGAQSTKQQTADEVRAPIDEIRESAKPSAISTSGIPAEAESSECHSELAHDPTLVSLSQLVPSDAKEVDVDGTSSGCKGNADEGRKKRNRGRRRRRRPQRGKPGAGPYQVDAWESLVPLMLLWKHVSIPAEKDLIPLPPDIALPRLTVDKANSDMLLVIERQIGRVPKGILGIGRFNSRTGEPSVIVVAPVVDGCPFPTCFWLVDSKISSFIGMLEEGGMIKKLENEFLMGIRDVKELIADNELYIRRRLSLLTTTMAKALNNIGGPDAAGVLLRRGIGGIVDFRRVRCLHMHYAMHLMEPCGSVIGKILDEQFPELRELV